MSFTVQGVPVGGTIAVTLKLPPGSAPTAVYKYINGSYVDATSQVTINGDEIKALLTDGGPSDEDGVANGTIVDPLVPVEPAVTGATGPPAQKDPPVR